MDNKLTKKELDGLMANPDLPQSIKDWIMIRHLAGNKLPSGTMAFIFRPGKADRPGAVLIFRYWKNWTGRNLRTPGVMNESPFWYRKMTRQDMIDEFISTRMAYWTYNDWDAMMADEKKKGATEGQLMELDSFRENYAKKMTAILL